MNAQRLEFLNQLTQHTITLMGISFIVGSLCTIFILLILEMLRRAGAQGDEEEAAED